MPTIDTFFQAAKQALLLDPALDYQRIITLPDTSALLSGRQTALSSGFAAYMQAHKPLPQAHDVNIVVTPAQVPLAVTYTEDVSIRPLAALDAADAQREGNDDFDAWYQAKLTSLQAASAQPFDPASAMLVVEQLRVLYPSAH